MALVWPALIPRFKVYINHPLPSVPIHIAIRKHSHSLKETEYHLRFTTATMSGPVATFAPQQAQPSALQAPQNPSNEDPLLVALREYITTGPDASNITTKELQAIYNDSVADATSKSHLETYLTTTSSPPAATWEASAIMSGNITITKASFHFDVSAPTEVAINIKGDAAGVFSPWTGPVK